MAEEQELQEGWQARDVGSAVAKVYAEAKRKVTLGVRAAAAWSIVVLIYAVLDTLGVCAVAHPVWELVAGLGVMLLSALALSRTPVPMLVTAIVIVVDLVLVGYRMPELYEKGVAQEMAFSVVRMLIAPVALSLVLTGYLGALSIQAFKQGFSPGQDWRTRLNPVMLNVIAVASCLGSIGIGVAVWFGAINAGFAQPGAYVSEQGNYLMQGEDDEDDGIVLPFMEKEKPPPFQDYPEAAKPIVTLDGLDSFAKREVEDAYEFAADTDEAGCMEEAQGRQSRCRDERCVHWSQVFARACLARSRKDPKYCDGVPDPTAVEPGQIWAQKLCAGRNFELCRELMYAVQGHCHSPEKAAAAKVAREAAEAAEAARAAAARASGQGTGNTEPAKAP